MKCTGPHGGIEWRRTRRDSIGGGCSNIGHDGRYGKEASVATRKQVSIAGVVILIVLLILAILWGSYGETVRGEVLFEQAAPARNPFAEAFSRFDERFKSSATRSVDQFARVTADNRADLLQTVVGDATFIRVSADGRLVPTRLNADQAAQYRGHVDALLQVGDLIFKIVWTLGDGSFANFGIVSSDLQPKSEPVLETLAHRIERRAAQPAVARLVRGPFVFASLASSSRVGSGQAQPASQDRFTVYNLLGFDVASATLSIGVLGDGLTVEYTEGVRRPLWTTSKDSTQKALTRRGRCVDARTNVTWASHLFNLKIQGGAALEFGASLGMVMHQGQEPLRVHRCR